jgi:uncharacterized protein
MSEVTDNAVASQDEKTLALLTHLSGIILGFIVPLIVWLVHKDRSDRAFLIDQAKEALNFQITLVLVLIAGGIVGTILTVIVIGPLITGLAWAVCILANLIFSIIGGVKANDGVAYRYPFAIRLIK